MVPTRLAIVSCELRGHDKRCAEKVAAHLALNINRNFGLDVTLQGLDVILRSHFNIHRL